MDCRPFSGSVASYGDHLAATPIYDSKVADSHMKNNNFPWHIPINDQFIQLILVLCPMSHALTRNTPLGDHIGEAPLSPIHLH